VIFHDKRPCNLANQVVSRLHATVLGKSCRRPAPPCDDFGIKSKYHKVSSFSFCFDSYAYLEFQDPNLRILYFLKLLAGTGF
jgi:hypothetical protein